MVDNCPFVPNANQTNADRFEIPMRFLTCSDAFGDACDTDADNDSWDDAQDNCPSVSNPSQLDTDKYALC